MTNEVRDLIVKHSFESPIALRTALQVCLAYPAIRDKLTRLTLESVARKLCERPSDGIWSTPLIEVSPRALRLRVRKAGWPESLWLAIERVKPDPNVWIAVVRPPIGIPCEHALCEALKQGIPSIGAAANHSTYLWGGWLTRQYRDWDSEETMLAMAEGEEIQNHLSGLLAAVGSIVDPIIAESQHAEDVRTAAAHVPDQAR